MLRPVLSQSTCNTVFMLRSELFQSTSNTVLHTKSLSNSNFQRAGNLQHALDATISSFTHPPQLSRKVMRKMHGKYQSKNMKQKYLRKDGNIKVFLNEPVIPQTSACTTNMCLSERFGVPSFIRNSEYYLLLRGHLFFSNGSKESSVKTCT